MRCRWRCLWYWPLGGVWSWRCTALSVVGNGSARCWRTPGWGEILNWTCCGCLVGCRRLRRGLEHCYSIKASTTAWSCCQTTWGRERKEKIYKNISRAKNSEGVLGTKSFSWSQITMCDLLMKHALFYRIAKQMFCLVFQKKCWLLKTNKRYFKSNQAHEISNDVNMSTQSTSKKLTAVCGICLFKNDSMLHGSAYLQIFCNILRLKNPSHSIHHKEPAVK